MTAYEPRTTIVIVTWNQAGLVTQAIRSARQQTVRCKILVIDNGSTDGTAELIQREFPDVELVVLAHNAGFAGGIAAALPRVSTELVALLNNDAIADRQWIERSIHAIDEGDDIASVAARMLLMSDDKTVNNAGIVLLDSLYCADRGLGSPRDGVYERPAEVFAASGGAAVYRRLPVLAVGGIDPDYFMYYEDVDLGWRLRLAGWRSVYCPAAIVRHCHAASSDVQSRTFALWNETNRLLTLARNAPLRNFFGAVIRFILTTASLVAKEVLSARPPDPVFSPSLRFRVLMTVARRLPLTMSRRPINVPRTAVLRAWRGVPDTPLREESL